MRIVMITDVFPKFSETFIVAKFLGLLDRGWDVHVLTHTTEPEAWAMFPQLKARPEVLDRVHIISNVEDDIEEMRPSIIYFPFGVLAVGWTHLRKQVDCKLVVSFRGFEFSDLEPEDRDFFLDVWTMADIVHLVSRDIWERAQGLGCPADKKHVIIPDAIDPEVFDPGGRDYADDVGTVVRPLRILSVGRLVWKKGYEHALQAVKLLVNDGHHLDYHIVGEGDYRPAVRFTIYDMNLENDVRLLGVQPGERVRTEMLWADIFLHPAVTEGFGVSVLEAQSMGLPVVCSDAGGLTENVVDGETGLVVPRRDPQALKDALGMLARDPSLRRHMGEAGRRRVVTHFCFEDQIRRFDRLYRDLLGLHTGTVHRLPY